MHKLPGQNGIGYKQGLKTIIYGRGHLRYPILISPIFHQRNPSHPVSQMSHSHCVWSFVFNSSRPTLSLESQIFKPKLKVQNKIYQWIWFSLPSSKRKANITCHFTKPKCGCPFTVLCSVYHLLSNYYPSLLGHWVIELPFFKGQFYRLNKYMSPW